ncbi:MAG: putative lipid II flippase FtsW [Butyrivibrio sp.]|nr:putative lipid II flippase FtsW [Butyrivibrio sp.]
MHSRDGKEYNNFIVRGGYIDYQSIFLVLIIAMFGVIMVYSASRYQTMLLGVSSIYYAVKQAKLVLAGVVALILVSYVNYNIYRKLATVIMALAIFLSGVVFVIGTASHGSTRWIPIGSIQFQPSEIAKIAIAIYTANACTRYPSRMNSLKGLFSITWPQMLCIGLIAKENMSTALVCGVIMMGIILIATPNLRVFFAACGILVALALVGIFAVGYRGARMKAWLNPESADGYQTLQSLYAVGSGGLFGKGLGQSVQKSLIPEAHNDMIFAVICEELGVFGATCVIILFAMLLIRFLYIAQDAKDRFGGLLVSGTIAQLGVQVFINIGVATNLMPNTGMALPFISSGGTSMLILMAEMGIVMNVARQGVPYEKVKVRKRA